MEHSVHNHTHTHTHPRPSRWGIFALIAVLLVAVLAGCAPGGGAKPLSPAQFKQLGDEMVAIEQLADLQALEEQKTLWKAEMRKTEDKTELGHLNFRLAYLAEYRETLTQPNPELRDYTEAQGYYQAAMKTGSMYASQASYRLGVHGALGLFDTPADSAKRAKQSWQPLTMRHDFKVWVRQAQKAEEPSRVIGLDALAGVGGPARLAGTEGNGPVVQSYNLAATVLSQLDNIYSQGSGWDPAYYRAVSGFVGFFKTISPTAGVVLALFFLAVVVKIITIPLTTAAFRGMRDMQRIQPMLKELQAKYKDDRQKLAEEQMKLMKEHNVSPAGGCLPMLIQLPIFYAVYHAVQVYAYGFANSGFLWITNLARPDLVLLILYAISMIITQKLTAVPSADPQQQALQTQMTYMMPIFLLFVLYAIPSAFVLYWFFLNVLSSVHQYYLMRRFRLEDAEKAAQQPATAAPTTSRKKGKP